MPTRRRRVPSTGLAKSPSGIAGFDRITQGGLPTGRPTLVCGGPGAARRCSPWSSWSAAPRGTASRACSWLRGDRGGAGQERRVARLRPRRAVERRSDRDRHVRVERSEIEETGEYDLEGLFVRLGYAIESVGAKRVVLDTHRGAVRRLRERGASCAPSCGGCSGGSRTRRHRGDHRRAGRRGSSPGRGSRSTSRTA